ncbi:GNAT family N-acetyltransferase [Janibacter sp. GXQ6167]|uniref:GNAT family N-acetyltransferase n=1 Tax=Janibacter sp. GXQ6167 TaxID=3240791 RepID=UPI0035265294
MTRLEWTPLTEADLPGVQAVAEACLERDGGLPELADQDRLRALFLTDTAIVGRDALGDILAATALGWGSGGRRIATGLVHPSVMGQGIGAELVQWSREQAAGEPVRVIAETISPEAEELFAQSGLHLVFSESVMRHSLRHIPVVRLPDGLVSLPFTDDTSAAFHHAYQQSFADQPGYEEGAAQAWGAWLRQQEGFRPEDSRVLVDTTGHVAGFVTLSDHWIEEVGVVPAWRGHKLGAHLVARSLTVFAKRGDSAAWLCVGSRNPARSLYERLGFRYHGSRGLYDEVPAAGPTPLALPESVRQDGGEPAGTAAEPHATPQD